MTLFRDSRAKTPRDQILYLEVETGDCPQALLRVLNLLVLQDVPPLSIAAERLPGGQHVLLGLEPLDRRRAELLLSKMLAIVSVADARYAPG